MVDKLCILIYLKISVVYCNFVFLYIYTSDDNDYIGSVSQ